MHVAVVHLVFIVGLSIFVAQTLSVDVQQLKSLGENAANGAKGEVLTAAQKVEQLNKAAAKKIQKALKASPPPATETQGNQNVPPRPPPKPAGNNPPKHPPKPQSGNPPPAPKPPKNPIGQKDGKEMKMNPQQLKQYVSLVQQAVPDVPALASNQKMKIGKIVDRFKKKTGLSAAQKRKIGDLGVMIQDGSFKMSDTNTLLSDMRTTLGITAGKITNDGRELVQGLRTQILRKVKGGMGTSKKLTKADCPPVMSPENLKLITMGSWNGSESANATAMRLKMTEDRALMMCQLRAGTNNIARVAEQGRVRMTQRMQTVAAKAKTQIDAAGSVELEFPDVVPKQFANGIDLSCAVAPKANQRKEVKDKLRSDLVSIEAFPLNSVEMLDVKKLSSPIKIDFKMSKADCLKCQAAFIDPKDPEGELRTDSTTKAAFVGGKCRITTDHLTDFALVDSAKMTDTEDKKNKEEDSGEDGDDDDNGAPAVLHQIPLIVGGLIAAFSY